MRVHIHMILMAVLAVEYLNVLKAAACCDFCLCKGQDAPKIIHLFWLRLLQIHYLRSFAQMYEKNGTGNQTVAKSIDEKLAKLQIWASWIPCAVLTRYLKKLAATPLLMKAP